MSYHMSNDNLSFLYGNSRGMFGVVYEGRWNKNTEVAIKTLRLVLELNLIFFCFVVIDCKTYLEQPYIIHNLYLSYAF